MTSKLAGHVEWSVKFVNGPVDDPFYGSLSVYANNIHDAVAQAETELQDIPDTLILTVECENY